MADCRPQDKGTREVISDQIPPPLQLFYCLLESSDSINKPVQRKTCTPHWIVLKHKLIQPEPQCTPEHFRASVFLLVGGVCDKVGWGQCWWFLWHECEWSTSDYQVTRAGLGLCAWTRVCMRAPPLSSPDATPLWLCPVGWAVLSSTASHHLSGICSSGLSCICRIAHSLRRTQHHKKQTVSWLTCCRSH